MVENVLAERNVGVTREPPPPIFLKTRTQLLAVI
jgi:hypothetical protein